MAYDFPDSKNVEAGKLFDNADANIPPNWDNAASRRLMLSRHLLLKVAEDNECASAFVSDFAIMCIRSPLKRHIALARILGLPRHRSEEQT